MAVLRNFSTLFSLDTLDTRFTSSAKVPASRSVEAKSNGAVKPYSETANSSSALKEGDRPPGTQPSRWNTPEYYFYYFAFITVVPWMFIVPYNVSKASDPQYYKFEPLLSPGWIPGRKVDNSDGQYASFRDNMPYMALLVFFQPLLRRLYNYFTNQSSKKIKSDEKANLRLKQRVSFDLYFAIILEIALHGASSIKVFAILYVNFVLATTLKRSYIPWAAWIFNVGILFANEMFHGYPFATIMEFISRFPLVADPKLLVAWGVWLDQHGGLMPRWEVLFNITILRLISFDMDYFWSLKDRGSSPVEKQVDAADLSERDRVGLPAPSGSYSLRNYFAYTMYSPLYLAGPILSFNDYVSQMRYPLPTITTRRNTMYAIRFLFCLLSMEVINHYIYTVAISKSNPDWSRYTPFQLSMLGYFHLHHIWLKLLLPWRFFRLWALLDGVDPPENMVRCMSDNYSALAFWRGWHRSYNRWVVRYLYVPLGGSGRGSSKLRSVFNLLLVFTFVALWHDISLRLLTWSWLIVLFILPELVCTMVLFPARRYESRPNTYRMLSGVGAVANILMMMAANLVGFAVGLDGLQGLVEGICTGWEGSAFLGAACAALFIGVMVMFEIREEERRKGIWMKC